MDQDTVFFTLSSFLPLILLAIFVIAYALPMTRRKGLGGGYALLCIVPVIGFFALIWIASRTDQEVLDRLRKLEGASQV